MRYSVLPERNTLDDNQLWWLVITSSREKRKNQVHFFNPGSQSAPNINDTRSFQETAIRSLVRRLRRAQERNALQNLIRAVETHDRETACIRIPRSLDGRMQGKLCSTCNVDLTCANFSSAEKNDTACVVLSDLAVEWLEDLSRVTRHCHLPLCIR